MKPGIYIHIPFCVTRCTYCDFATVRYSEDLVPRYCAAVVKEIGAFPQEYIERVGCRVDSVYLGGGTPSTVDSALIATILGECRRRFQIDPESEITIEVDPGTIDLSKAQALGRMGINRISLGVQSFNDSELSLVRRAHRSQDAMACYQLLRQVGFSNINIDFIIGLPGQTAATWDANLAHIARLRPEHVSVYMLELEEGTPLFRQLARGSIELPDDAFVVECYYRAIDFLSAEGYEHYEISNFALADRFSRHNMKYWCDLPYYGFGLSSHGYLGFMRYANESKLQRYLSQVETYGRAIAQVTEQTADCRAAEALFLGLRRIAGIDLDEFRARYRIDPLDLYGSEIRDMLDKGLLSVDGSRLRLTRKGLPLANEVFAAFV